MKFAAIALCVTVVFTVTGCGSGDSKRPTASAGLSQGTNHPTPTLASSESASSSEGTASADPSTSAPEQEDAAPKKFGSRFTYEDGLVVQVAKPAPFKPSEYAAAEPAASYLSFKVTIINGTGKRYDPALFTVSVQSNDTEANEVYDSENGFKGSPDTAVLPGRESSFKVGFGVPNPKDLVVEVSPGFEYDSVFFTS